MRAAVLGRAELVGRVEVPARRRSRRKASSTRRPRATSASTACCVERMRQIDETRRREIQRRLRDAGRRDNRHRIRAGNHFAALFSSRCARNKVRAYVLQSSGLYASRAKVTIYIAYRVPDGDIHGDAQRVFSARVLAPARPGNAPRCRRRPPRPCAGRRRRRRRRARRRRRRGRDRRPTPGNLRQARTRRAAGQSRASLSARQHGAEHVEHERQPRALPVAGRQRTHRLEDRAGSVVRRPASS